MTVSEARALLSGPLVFGDPAQIKAVRLIEQMYDEPEYVVCAACGGSGECPCCNGDGGRVLGDDELE